MQLLNKQEKKLQLGNTKYIHLKKTDNNSMKSGAF